MFRRAGRGRRLGAAEKGRRVSHLISTQFVANRHQQHGVAPCEEQEPSDLQDLRLFVPEGFDGIEASRLVGRVQSEEQADHERE